MLPVIGKKYRIRLSGENMQAAGKSPVRRESSTVARVRDKQRFRDGL
ncbi:hypothetical protein SALBM135S_10164 [Streptomyces alboniger]